MSAVGRFALANRRVSCLARPPFSCQKQAVQLLYLDDSGSVQNRGDAHIILAGFACGERDPHWIGQDLDRIAARIWPDNPLSLEFRAADMFSGKKHWRGVSRAERRQAYTDALSALAGRRTLRFFGAVMCRDACGLEDPLELAFEMLAARFDRMLGRLHKGGDTQRGLIILDESAYETSIQSLALNFRRDGHRWGKLHNLSEVPLFIDSRASRLIQAADLIAYAPRKAYEHSEASHLDIIARRFDAVGGRVFGLIHHVLNNEQCDCRACRHGVREDFAADNDDSQG